MKSFILILTLSVFSKIYSQAVVNDYVIATPDRSEVWIIDDSVGRLIYENWKRNPVSDGIRPKVTLVKSLAPYRKKVNKMIEKSKTK